MLLQAAERKITLTTALYFNVQTLLPVIGLLAWSQEMMWQLGLVTACQKCLQGSENETLLSLLSCWLLCVAAVSWQSQKWVHRSW